MPPKKPIDSKKLFLEADPDFPPPGLTLEEWTEALAEIGFPAWIEALRMLPVRNSEDGYGEVTLLPQANERYVTRRIDGQVFRFRPSEPTIALPGTPQKLAVLQARAQLGLELFHPLDAQRSQ